MFKITNCDLEARPVSLRLDSRLRGNDNGDQGEIYEPRRSKQDRKRRKQTCQGFLRFQPPPPTLPKRV